MPYDRVNDVYKYGKNFPRSGVGYRPNYRIPTTWKKLLDELRRSGTLYFHIIATGKIYKSKNDIGGVTGLATDFDSIEEIFQERSSVEMKVALLLGLPEIPQHITYLEFIPED